MEAEFLDLIPLFLAESRERVAHLLQLAPAVETSTAAVVEARREFHTLKGSCRMLKLAAPAQLCADGEEVLAELAAGAAARVAALAEGLSAMLDGVERQEGATAAAATAVSSPAARGGRPLRVLLVEDSVATREMERRLLEDEGFEVVAVASAREAMTALGDRTFHCVITDLEMPEMSGLELTHRLRESERFAQLPVIILSTLDGAEDRLAGLHAGADAYLTKQELRAPELAALIRRLGSAA